MNFPAGQTITLLGNGTATPDEYGDPVPTQTPKTVIGAFDPGGSTENQGQDTATSQPTVYLPPGTDVSWVDAVQVGGVTYQVDGSPGAWSSPFSGVAFGVVVRLSNVLAEPR